MILLCWGFGDGGWLHKSGGGSHHERLHEPNFAGNFRYFSPVQKLVKSPAVISPSPTGIARRVLIDARFPRLRSSFRSPLNHLPSDSCRSTLIFPSSLHR